MDIKTKLNIGDSVFFLHEKKAIECIIRGIKTDTENNAPNSDKGEVKIATEITYLCNKERDQKIHVKVEEQYAFKSKAELLKSL